MFQPIWLAGWLAGWLYLRLCLVRCHNKSSLRIVFHEKQESPVLGMSTHHMNELIQLSSSVNSSLLILLHKGNALGVYTYRTLNLVANYSSIPLPLPS